MQAIDGYATLAGTEQFFISKEISSRQVRTTPWFKCIPMAMGTHLGSFSDEDSHAYVAAIETAVDLGINFVDTAVNYRGMRSERDVGQALHSLIVERGNIAREELIISTKGGQIFGDIYLDLPPLDYLHEVLIKEGILSLQDVNIVENYRFTLVPKFYEHSLQISKRNLGLSTIDIHYIHNPSISRKVLGEASFYSNLEKLIAWYETKVEEGCIRHYGMATWWGLLADPTSEWHISLEKVLDVVRAIAGEQHHFRFVQMPLNMGYSKAKDEATQKVRGKSYSAINAATELGLYVTISAPLNQGQELLDGSRSPAELLRYVVNTKGVLAAMVGTKTRAYVEQNFQAIIGK